MENPTDYLMSLSDKELSQMACENLELHSTTILPDGTFREFTLLVAKYCGQPFNTTLAEAFLYPEIIKRFISSAAANPIIENDILYISEEQLGELTGLLLRRITKNLYFKGEYHLAPDLHASVEDAVSAYFERNCTRK